MATARRFVAVLSETEDEQAEGAPPEDEEADAATGATPYVADAFAELVATVHAWLHQADGVLSQDAVVPLIKALGFKTRAVITALARDVFWSHPEADSEILTRTPAGAAQHPKPLPDVYLHENVRQNLADKIRSMGSKTKVDKIAGALGWNAKSELRKTYGTLRVVLMGLREVFYDPGRLYLKRALDGVVEWPVSKEGRLGPHTQPEEISEVMHWTPAVDDLRGAGDPDWLSVKRQILGAIMSFGGRCDASLLRPLLQRLDSVVLEDLFNNPGGERDLSAVLFWGHDRVCRRRPEAVEEFRLSLDAQVATDVRAVLVDMVTSKGSVTLADLKVALDDANLPVKVDDQQLYHAVQRIPELFFMPELVLLRYVASLLVLETPAEMPENIEKPSDECLEASAAAETELELLRLMEDGQTDETPAEADAAETKAPVAQGGAAVDAEAEGAEACESVKAKFFSFGEFAPEAPIIERAPVKKRRLASVAAGDVAWTEDTPQWATKGVAVTVRDDYDHQASKMLGVIVQTNAGATVTVRLLLGDRDAGAGPGGLADGGLAGGGLAVERDLPISALLPVAPKVGSTVKVVAGARTSCVGKLVGLAGAQAVVQIGTMSYETLPMSSLAVLAS